MISKKVEQAIHKSAFLVPRGAHERHNASALREDKETDTLGGVTDVVDLCSILPIVLRARQRTKLVVNVTAKYILRRCLQKSHVYEGRQNLEQQVLAAGQDACHFLRDAC